MELLDQRCREIEDFSGRLARCGDNLTELLKDVFPDLDPRPLDDAEATQEVRFQCRCSRQRSVAALMLLGQEELQDMLQKDGGAELTCHFCNTKYNVDDTELQSLIHAMAAAA